MTLSPPRIAFCITVKGRSQHVKLTLPKNLEDNKNYENLVFIVLDYNSPDDLGEYLKASHADDIASGRLVVYSMPSAGVFRMAHAKNCAHRAGILECASILINVDADNYLGAGFAQYVAEAFATHPDIFMWAKMIPHILPRGISGRIVVSKDAFLNTGGYDERYSEWGPDDKNFNMRLRRLGYVAFEIDVCYLDAVRHNDKMRFKEYPHAANAGPEDELESAFCESTIANFGNFGCGIVYRNFCDEPIELKPLPTRILCIGLHKTGTTSLHDALEILGYNSGHWRSAHWAKKIWTEMTIRSRSPTLERCYALSDLPIPLLYREIDRAYPGSKFILTHRDEKSWLRSVKNHWDPTKNPFRAQWDTDPFTHKIHRELYGRKNFDAGIFLERYRRHNKEVREYFKDRPADLLELDIMEGKTWERLCGFLDIPYPDMPYPNKNISPMEIEICARETIPFLSPWGAVITMVLAVIVVILVCASVGMFK